MNIEDYREMCMVTCFRSLTATISASSRLNVSRNRIDELKAEYDCIGKPMMVNNRIKR